MRPVVVIGAGPLGLAAAAHLRARGIEMLVLEAGRHAGAAVARWGHIRLHTPWPMLADALSARLISPDWSPATRRPPTGDDWIAEYLTPLADALSADIRYHSRVTAVRREDRGLAPSHTRPLVVELQGAAGSEAIEAAAVIDASGTWRTPNPAGGDGNPAPGEEIASAAGLLTRLIPTSEEAARMAGKAIAVLGGGDSAFAALVELRNTVADHPNTVVTQITRRKRSNAPTGLPAPTWFASVDGFHTSGVATSAQGARLCSHDGRMLGPFQHVLVLTGFRPDFSFFDISEVRAIAARGPELLDSATGRLVPGIHIIGTKGNPDAAPFLAAHGYARLPHVIDAIEAVI